jgi:hypothetical protein
MTIKQLFPSEPKGKFARQLTTLAAMVAGIVQARSCQLAAIARKTPDEAKADSWVIIIHRSECCDWSLFRLGLALLDHFLNDYLPIPGSFNLIERNFVR